jgi:hypothetical protein
MLFTRKVTSRRSLTMWVLIAIALLSGGCQRCRWTCYKCLINPYVCPSCDAKSVDQCHCYSAVENAGYCETTWAPLETTMDEIRYETFYSEEVEVLELPDPSLESNSSNVAPDDAVMQASYSEPASANPESEAPGPEWVSDASWKTESQVPADQSDGSNVAPVDEDYQPLEEYFRGASE